MNHKVFIIIVVCVFNSISIYAQSIIRYPSFEISNAPEFHIDSISIDKKYTKVYCTYINFQGEGSWVNINKNTQIIEHGDSHKLTLLKAENIAISPERAYPDQSLNPILYFSPIRFGNKIDLIENANDSTAFNIYGISLNESGKPFNYSDVINESNLRTQADYYQSSKNYEKALLLERRASAIYKNWCGGSSYWYTYSIENQANLYMLLNKYEEANKLYMTLDSIYKRTPHLYSNVYIYHNNQRLTDSFFHLGDIDTALKYAKYNYELLKSDNITDEAFYQNQLVIARIYAKQGNLESALELYIEVYEWYQHHKESDDLVYLMDEITALYLTLNRIDDAINLLNKSSFVHNELYVKSICNFADKIKNINPNESKIILDKGIGLWQERKDTLTFDYTLALRNLAFCDNALGNHYSAIAKTERAMNIIRSLSGPNSMEYCSAALDMVNYLLVIEEFDKANEWLESIIKTDTTSIKEYGMNYCALLQAKSHIKAHKGNIAPAKTLIEKAICIVDSIQGKDNADYTILADDLARYEYELGNYIKAKTIYQEVLQITKMIDVPSISAKALCQLSYCYEKLGDISNAIKYMEEGLSTYKKLNMQLQQDCLGYTMSYSLMLYMNNQKDQAIKIAKENVSNIRKTLGCNHRDYSIAINNLANITDSYSDTIELLKESLKIDSIKNDKYGVAVTLGNLGIAESSIGNYDTAINYLKESLQAMKSINLENHPYYRDYLLDLSLIEMRVGENSNSINNFEKYFELTKNDITDYFSLMSDNERYYYLEKCKSSLKKVLNAGLVMQDPKLMGIAYNIILFSKGLLLNTNNLIKEHLSGYSLALYNEIEEKKRIYFDGLSVGKEALFLYIEGKQRELVNILSKENSITKETLSWQDVQNALKEEDVAIEFADYYADNDSIRHYYVAIVLNQNSSSPVLVPLFEESEINVNDISQLYNKIWQPIEQLLKGKTNIYVSPSGILNVLPMESLIAPNKFVLGEIFNIFRVTSTRSLCKKKESTQPNVANLFGGLYYQENFKSGELVESKYEQNIDRFDRGGVDYLPNTLIEVNSIFSLLQDDQLKVNSYTEDKGTEEAFRAISGLQDYNILHIATHGFYWNAPHEHLSHINKNGFVDIEDYALSKTGLFLSGANGVLQGKNHHVSNDGIITALEISNLNLSKTELVVLSACETGLGEISSEGVFGLQRGFKKAGVGSILMCIDNVDDKATRILMVEFYKNLVSGLSKRESLLNAQKYLRTYNEGEYSDPKYWTPFILVDAFD